MNKNKLIYALLFIILITLIIVYILIEVNNERISMTNMESSNSIIKNTKSMGFGSYMLNENDKMLTQTILTENNSFEGNFAAGGYFEEDTNFDIILLRNFKQVEFSIDGVNKAEIQKIAFLKSSQNKYELFKHNIVINNLEDGINEFVLIFSKEFKKEDIDFYKKYGGVHRTTFITRFTVQKGNENTLRKDIKFDNNYKILSGSPLPDCFIYNTDFSEFTHNFSSNNSIIYNPITFLDGISKWTRLPISINTSSLLEGSYYNQDYIEDENANKIEQLAVFSIINNKLAPVYYGQEKEYVHFYEKKLNDNIMITPKVEFTEKGINSFVIIVLSYPYRKQEEYIDTYKITKWSSGVISHRLYVNVVD